MTFTRFTDSASLKYRRAQYHYRCLIRAYTRLQNTNFRLGPHKLGPEGGKIMPRIQPNQRWGLIIGDCAQNLRAALDHAVYQVVPEATRSVHAKDIEFPIFDDSGKYAAWKRRHSNWLSTIDANAIQIIDQLQPCDPSGHDPHGHILWKLSRLSNIDKHRSLLPAFLGLGALSPSEAFVVQASQPDTGELVITPTPKQGQTDMKLRVTVQVAFAEGEDIARLPVFPMLVHIGQTVSQTLNRLRRYTV
jgi:hypothetical protein